MKLKWPGFDAATVAEIEDYLDMEHLTEVSSRVVCGTNLGLEYTYARGHYQRGGTHHHRPMFEVFGDGVGSALSLGCRMACPDCDDWSRTARCEYHPEVSLDDHQRQARESFDDAWRPEPAPGVGAPAVTLNRVVQTLRNHYYSFEVASSGPRWAIVVE